MGIVLIGRVESRGHGNGVRLVDWESRRGLIGVYSANAGDHYRVGGVCV